MVVVVWGQEVTSNTSIITSCPQYTTYTTDIHTRSTKCQYNTTDRTPWMQSVLLAEYKDTHSHCDVHSSMRIIPTSTCPPCIPVVTYRRPATPVCVVVCKVRGTVGGTVTGTVTCVVVWGMYYKHQLLYTLVCMYLCMCTAWGMSYSEYVSTHSV